MSTETGELTIHHEERGHRGAFFIEHNGLKPHRVVPTPTFLHGQAVEMTEGYVDIEKLKLWGGNHRISLQVQEFEEHHGREPEEDELVPLMHGSILLPSLEKDDPFELKPLADSFGRKGNRVATAHERLLAGVSGRSR